MDSEPESTYCCKISYETTGKLIGLFCYIVLILNCTCYFYFEEAQLFFIVNAVLYVMVCLSFTWHIAANQR